MKIARPEPCSKSDTMENQALTKRAKHGPKQSETHTFQWNGNGGVATCTCGSWTLWGASLDSAKRSHDLHRLNRRAS